MTDTPATPEDALYAKQRASIVAQAINALPLRYQRVVELRMDGAKLKEIAAELNVSVERARQIWLRSLHKMRPKLRCLAPPRRQRPTIKLGAALDAVFEAAIAEPIPSVAVHKAPGPWQQQEELWRSLTADEQAARLARFDALIKRQPPVTTEWVAYD